MKRILILGLSLLLLLSAGCIFAVKPEPEETEVTEPVVSEAPETEEPERTEPFVIEEPAQEKGVELSFDTVTLYGDPISTDVLHEYDLIIVNCWAEWCGPCVGELPELERIYEEYPNVLILGVLSFSYDMDGAKAVLAESGVTYPAFEPAGTLIARVATFNAIPTTMFFDRHGNEIAEPIVGSMDYDGWKTTVEGLLP